MSWVRFNADFDTSLDNISVDAPEPVTAAILGLGLIGVGAARRRRA